MKQTYTSPAIHIVQVGMGESIAQFVVTSKSVPENSGDAKGSDFFDEEYFKTKKVVYLSV